MREPAGALEQSHLKASSKPTPEEKDNRKIEKFIQQFQEQYAAGLIQRNSPSFKAERHEHGEGDASGWSSPPADLCILALRKPRALAARTKHVAMEGDSANQRFSLQGHKGN